MPNVNYSDLFKSQFLCGQCPQTMRAQVVSNRYAPDPHLVGEAFRLPRDGKPVPYKSEFIALFQV